MASRLHPQGDPAVDYLDDEVADDSHGYHEGIRLIVRGLLLAPEYNVDATTEATQQVRQYYHEMSLKDDCPWENQDDHSIPWFLSASAGIALEVATHVPLANFRHGRLVDFLVGFKEQAAEKFDPKDPQLIWFQGAYSEAIAEEGKRRYSSQAELIEVPANDVEAKKACEERINFSSVAARLLAKDVLTSIEVEHLAQDIVDGLEGRKSDQDPPQLLLDFRAVVAVRHLVLASDMFVREAKKPTSSRGADLLSVSRWKAWAAKLEELAAARRSDASWPVNDIAQEALGKMKRLYPEVTSG